MALLKNMFDHICFMMHRPCFFKSKALILTTTGGVSGFLYKRLTLSNLLKNI